ncbi:MAG: peptidylprolyl isomerase [Coriobacteriales bacterium]|jgi:peptidyl-prolyl cis-trans isomerase B (cyclophilin B)
MNRKKIASLLIALSAAALLVLALAGCGSGSSDSSSSSSSSSSSGAASSSAASSDSSSSSSSSSNITTSASGKYASGKHTAVVKVKGYDSFKIELDADAAPITVSNFCKLANKGYYDGLAFYRVVDGFCLQGGTKGNSASGQDSSLKAIKGEFSSNGVENELADNFKKGTVAMARTTDPDSATSTFFITLGSSENVSGSLNGEYAAFGTISDSDMKTVDKIVKAMSKKKADSMGVLTSEKDMPIISSIKITK